MNDSNSSYVPISCSFYDYLEEAATLGSLSTIEYLDNTIVLQVESKI
jgi:transcriptional antiterminator Rof (Rho-off)